MKPKLIIANRSRYPEAEVAYLVRFAFDTVHSEWPVNLDTLTIRVTDCVDHWRGRAYVNGGGRFYDGSQVIVRIGSPEKFKNPVRISYDHKWREMPEYWLKSYREAIIYIAAHEFGHSAGRGGRKNGEMYCEFAGQDAVDQYRKRQAEVDAECDRRVSLRLARAQQTEARQRQAKAEKNSPAYRLSVAQAKLDELERQARRLAKRIGKAKRSVSALKRSVAKRSAIIEFPTQTEKAALP